MEVIVIDVGVVEVKIKFLLEFSPETMTKSFLVSKSGPDWPWPPIWAAW